jgi:hypothetical protein
MRITYSKIRVSLNFLWTYVYYALVPHLNSNIVIHIHDCAHVNQNRLDFQLTFQLIYPCINMYRSWTLAYSCNCILFTCDDALLGHACLGLPQLVRKTWMYRERGRSICTVLPRFEGLLHLPRRAWPMLLGTAAAKATAKSRQKRVLKGK